jgi:hypothetical protein
MINVVRALALTLVVTGAVATNNATSNNSSVSNEIITPTRSSMLPKPMCPPDDPTGCGTRNVK